MTTEAAPKTVQIRIHRSREYFAKLRGYRVRIDGEDVANVRDGQTLTLDVAPGPHELELRVDWCRSNTIEFYASEGALDFECLSAMKQFPKIFLSILYCSIWYDRCLVLRPSAVVPEVAMAAR